MFKKISETLYICDKKEIAVVKFTDGKWGLINKGTDKRNSAILHCNDTKEKCFEWADKK